MEPAGAEDFDMLIFHTASEKSTPWCALGADRVLATAAIVQSVTAQLEGAIVEKEV